MQVEVCPYSSSNNCGRGYNSRNNSSLCTVRRNCNDNIGTGKPRSSFTHIPGGASGSHSFDLQVKAAGKTNTNAKAMVTLHIQRIVDVSNNGKILKLQAGSTFGDGVTRSRDVTAATYELSNIKVTNSGAKVTITASFVDQDCDDGKIQLTLFARNSINPNKDTSFSMTNGNNNLLLKYNSISDKFFASGKNVQARIDFS